jgi:hypothetical protein
MKLNNLQRIWFAMFSFSLLGIQGCGHSDSSPFVGTRSQSSFEHGMDDWTTAAADIGNPSQGGYAPWSIDPSIDYASDGQWALKFHMENNTDAAKIWIVRPFTVTDGQAYRVEISYDFGTADYGPLNNFQLLIGVFSVPPADGPALIAGTTHADTGTGQNSDVEYVWLPKSFQITAPGNEKGLLYVVIGIWGTFEITRNYYLDNIVVQLSPE